MKIKFLILFLFTGLFFTGRATPPDTACDVLTLMNGNLIYCKVKSIGLNKVKYTNCKGNTDSTKELDRTSVFMVNYPNGDSKILTHLPTDSLHKPEVNRKVRFLLGLNGGAAIPAAFDSYGTSSYYNSSSGQRNDAGFASTGLSLNSNIEIRLADTWGIILAGNYFNNPFDATGFLNSNTIFIGYIVPLFPLYVSSSSFMISSQGSYFYTNYSFFIGISCHTVFNKIWTLECYGGYGKTFLNVPSITGTVNVFYHYSAKPTQDSIYNLEISKSNYTLPIFDFGGRLGIDLTKHLNTFIDMNILFSIPHAEFNIPCYATGPRNGNTVLYMNTPVFVLNTCVGIEFRF